MYKYKPRIEYYYVLVSSCIISFIVQTTMHFVTERKAPRFVTTCEVCDVNLARTFPCEKMIVCCRATQRCLEQFRIS